ncbi:MAG: FMN-binding protein [Candidatus Cryosericum sp.]
MKRLIRGFVIAGTVIILMVIMAVAVYGLALGRAAAAISYQSPVISFRYPGVYEGSASCLHVVARVRVTMGSTGISQVELLQRPAGDMDTLVARIIKAGGVPVDVITGATASSKVVMKAVDNALMKQKP